MRYKCFCAKDFRDLTVEEIRHMRRSPNGKSLDLDKFLEYYEITIEDYSDRVRNSKGINLIGEERKFWVKYREKKENGKKEIKKVYTINSIPDSMVAALYQVDFEVIKGEVYFDTESLQRAREDMNRKIETFNTVVEETKDTTAYSELRGIDLVAMRIYRGKNRRTFSKISGLRMSDILMYEKEKLKIPKYIADSYKEVLHIKDRHIYQLRDIMNGKSDRVEEDRTIPKLVKVRVYKRDKGRCTKCGSKDKLHYHHIKHFADGGQNTPENLTLLCASCHAEEHKGEKSYNMLKSMATEE